MIAIRQRHLRSLEAASKIVRRSIATAHLCYAPIRMLCSASLEIAVTPHHVVYHQPPIVGCVEPVCMQHDQSVTAGLQRFKVMN